MLQKLNGKVAVVSGVSCAIGARVALRLIRDANMSVVGLSRRQPDLELLREHHIPTDITSEEQCAAAAKQIKSKFGQIHLLVHCAGITSNRLLLKSDGNDVQGIMETNVTGSLMLTKHVLRHGGMLSTGTKDSATAGQTRCVIFIGSTVGMYGNAGQVAYSCSKAALSGAAMSLSKEYGSVKIRFNTVAPGLVEGPGMASALQPSMVEHWKSTSCLKRLVSVEDVADTVLMIAACEMINGQTIAVDGGRE